MEILSQNSEEVNVVDYHVAALTTEAGGPRGYDAGKKINGRKRHTGRALVLELHPASIQDRDGGGPLLCASRVLYPFITHVFAGSGYTTSESRTPRTSSSPTRLAREVLRVDQSKPEAGEGFRSFNRLGKGLPLRRLCHAPCSLHRQGGMNFETES
jgi:hypothetical protein